MDNKKKNMKHYGLHLFFGEKNASVGFLRGHDFGSQTE